MPRKHEWQRENEFGSALWMLQHRIESGQLRLAVFFVAGARVRTRIYLYKNAWRTKPAFYRWETNS